MIVLWGLSLGLIAPRYPNTGPTRGAWLRFHIAIHGYRRHFFDLGRTDCGNGIVSAS